MQYTKHATVLVYYRKTFAFILCYGAVLVHSSVDRIISMP